MPIMSVVIPVGLYLLALVIRLLVAGELPFPTTEPSAYYVDVAQNLVAGEGLVSHGVWSYATPPLEVPKPAFELWLPMSSFVSATAMSVLGSSFWAAQVGSAVLGALVAPLAWGLAREAGRAQSLDARRGGAVAIASGLLAAVLSPLVLASVVPDSFVPFTVFLLIGALLIPRVLGVRDSHVLSDRRPSILAGLGLGIALGLTYLSRQEVIWLGLTVLLMLGWVSRSRPVGTRLRDVAGRLWPVVAGGLIVVVPWLVRNYADLGSPFPGQAVENLFLVQNEDIFAFSERPGAGTYLDQGLATILWNPIAAAWDSLVNVIVLPAFPIGLAGLIALVGMRHSPALRSPTALVAVLISAALTFASTMLLFPVATLWGTFMHASGPLLVALIVLAALGGDALLARISALRGWEKPNVILAPIALLAVAGVLAFFQIRVFSDQSHETEDRYAALGTALSAVSTQVGGEVPATLITDHPMWLADALDGTAVALPDEEPASIIALSRLFDAPWVVVVGERGRYPGALLDPGARACLTADPVALTDEPEPAWLFQLDQECLVT
jgi:hypothetical protein